MRLLFAYLISPLAAALAASLLPYPSAVLFALPLMYVICLGFGIPSFFILRLLPTRSPAIYILFGVAVGIWVAPSIEIYIEIFSHGHVQPNVATLAWAAIRSALAGGIGLAVFWYLTARDEKQTPQQLEDEEKNTPNE